MALTRQAEHRPPSRIFSGLTTGIETELKSRFVLQAWGMQKQEQAPYSDLAYSFPLVALFLP